MPDHGYFAGPDNLKPLEFQVISTDHLRGKPLPGILGRIFFWVRVPQYVLSSDVVYLTPEDTNRHRKLIRVPTGFVFDGGSVPFLFWWVYPPDQSECLAGFVVHDWCCTPRDDGTYTYDSRDVHDWLYHAAIANGASRFRAGNIRFWVRIAGPKFTAGGK